MRLLPVCVALQFTATPAHANLAGQATVIDGDTLEIHGKQNNAFTRLRYRVSVVLFASRFKMHHL